jgi:hypothetical protein
MTEQQREYYAKHAVSSTILKGVVGSDTMVINAINNAYKGGDSAPFRMGRLVHEMIHNRENITDDFHIVDASTRATNIYKAAAAEHPTKTVMLLKEMEEATAMSDSVRATRYFDFIANGNPVYEKPIYGTYTHDEVGTVVDTKALPDVLWVNKQDELVITDFKTTSESSPTAWMRYAKWKFGYDLQAAWYHRMVSEHFKSLSPVVKFSFMAVCKEPPYHTWVVEFDVDSQIELKAEVSHRLRRAAFLWNKQPEEGTYLGTYKWGEEPTIKQADFSSMPTPFDDEL